MKKKNKKPTKKLYKKHNGKYFFFSYNPAKGSLKLVYVNNWKSFNLLRKLKKQDTIIFVHLHCLHLRRFPQLILAFRAA